MGGAGDSPPPPLRAPHVCEAGHGSVPVCPSVLLTQRRESQVGSRFQTEVLGLGTPDTHFILRMRVSFGASPRQS